VTLVKALGRWLLNATAVVAVIAATASGAWATTALLYDDVFGASSRWSAALQAQGFTTTSVSTDAAFLSALAGPPTFNVVIVHFGAPDPTDPTSITHMIDALTTYTGKVIYASSVTQYDAAFQVSDPLTFTQRTNMFGSLPATLDVGAVFSAGLSSSSLSLDTGSYTVAWRSFSTGATVAGTFEEADMGSNAGIVIGNNNRTIINGFLGDTLDQADEIQLYRNELGFLTAPVPEPATATLLGLGLVVTAALGYRRRTSARD
jgi:PEP-CTERM motif